MKQSSEEQILYLLLARVCRTVAEATRSTVAKDPVAQVMLGLRRWAVETLQAKQTWVGGKGTAALNRAILRWLESCRHYDVAPPQELIDAIARQLKVESGIPNDRHKRKLHEIALIACALDPQLSEKKLARLCGLSRPTIALWKKEPSFSPLVAGFRNIFAGMTKDEKDTALKEADFPWQQR